MADIASLIEECGAIKRGKFTLSDGSLSDYYIDKYVFETEPRVLDAVTETLVDRLEDADIDVIAGPTLGAVPLVTAVSLQSGVPAAYVRMGDTHTGTQARIEGTIDKGQRVVIVEDVTTTGATIVQTANVVEDAGGIVERLLVVVDRDEGAADRIEREGYDLEWLVRVGEDLDIESVVEG